MKEERHVKKEKRDVEDSFEAEFIAAQANQIDGHTAVKGEVYTKLGNSYG